MRRSSSTSSKCGASSAGRRVSGAKVAAWATSFLCGWTGSCKELLQELVGNVVIDHGAQELAYRILAGRTDVPQRAVDSVGLQSRELGHQRLTLCGGEKKALPAVVVAGPLHDIAFIEQLL